MYSPTKFVLLHPQYNSVTKKLFNFSIVRSVIGKKLPSRKLTKDRMKSTYTKYSVGKVVVILSS